MSVKRLLIIGLLLITFSATVSAIDSTNVESYSVRMVNPEGNSMGTVVFRQLDNAVQVVARVRGLTPGFHGFHIHEVGLCEATDDSIFLSAGGHFDHLDDEGNKQPHGEHAGDLPMLLALQDGTAALSFTTDRFVMADLMDADGSAMIIHSGADNYANIPERYGGPDEMTLAAGDAGSRVSCGVVFAPQ